MARIWDLPNAVEDFGPTHRAAIVSAVEPVMSAYGYDVEGVYVVGSYCFNLSDPGDLDLVITSPGGHSLEDYRDIPELRRFVWGMGREIGEGVDLQIVKPGRMATENRGSDLGMLVPFYDVIAGELHHKAPYAKVYFSFVWNYDNQNYTTYMRDKRTMAFRRLF